MILRNIRWEGMGYSRINSNRVSKLLHLSTKLGAPREDEDSEIYAAKFRLVGNDVMHVSG